ncbi:hypothetical protein FRB90_005122, partial [Tulasnella sp. 427]
MSTDLLTTSNVSLAASSLALLYFFKIYWDRGSHPPFPPGPPGLPFIGNLLDMPRKQFVLTYSKWGEEYGPVTWAAVPGRRFLILHTYDAMCELLDKRGGIYIDRPVGVMSNKLVGIGFTTGRRMGDSTWQRHRRFLRQALAPNVVKQQYADLFVANASRYLQALLRHPADFYSNLKRILGETIEGLTFGAVREDDEVDYVAEQEEFFGYTKRASIGYLVDLFPLLRFILAWFPGAQFQRDARKWREHSVELRRIMKEGVERRMTGADIRDDIQAVHDSGLNFFQVGSDTTEITLKNFMLAMTLFPDVQARARKEVEAVFRDGGLPDFANQNNMPYVHACILESPRWNPPASFGFPHASRHDDLYQGYLIPKGTTVIANLWKLARDPTIYDSPSTFNPDRFINNPDILDPRDFIFGFGRRICPGNYLAYHMTWIFVVSILWGYELKRPEGELSLDQDDDRFDLGTNFTTGRRQGDVIWRRHRKFLRQALSMDTVKKEYSDLFIINAFRYLRDVRLKPEGFLQSLKR